MSVLSVLREMSTCRPWARIFASTASIAFSSASGCMTMIMVDSLKKSGGPWAARRWLKLFAGVLSVSAAPGGQPVVEIPSERGCSPHIAIVHGEFDVEDDPGVHGASLAWLTRLAVRPRIGRS